MTEQRSDIPQEERRTPLAPPAPVRQTERVPCTLTPGEVIARGQELALLMGEMEQIRDALSMEKAAAKTALEERQGKLNQLAKEIRERAVYREIDVEEQEDGEELVIQVVRCDSGEVIRERPMTEEERQRSLFRTHNRGAAPAEED